MAECNPWLEFSVIRSEPSFAMIGDPCWNRRLVLDGLRPPQVGKSVEGELVHRGCRKMQDPLESRSDAVGLSCRKDWLEPGILLAV
jgi:hypothetical protein